MPLLLISVFIIVLLTVYAWMKNKDLTCPSVMFGCFWILSLLVAQLYSDIISDIQIVTMVMFSGGAILFHLGYKCGFSSGKGNIDLIMINPAFLRPTVFIMSFFFAYVMYEFMTKGVGDSVYEMLKNEENEDLTLGGYFRKIVEYTAIGILLIYWKTPDHELRRNVRKYVILLSTMALICAFSIPSRNAMLQFFLPVVVVYLSTHSIPMKKQAIYMILCLVAFIGYYSYISANKYSYKYERANTSQEVLSSEMQVYLSGSIVAFDQCIEEHSYTRYGRNTFRFFYAVFDRGNAEALVNDFFLYKYLSTNVFTFYDFYIRDFGPLYALFMQFLIGFFHGRAYKNRQSAMGLYFFSMMSYPLVMQFFQDQYFSLTSTWIQIFITSLILFKTRIFAFVTRDV